VLELHESGEAPVSKLFFWWVDEKPWLEEKLRCQKLYGPV
jgi:hypothetical protein